MTKEQQEACEALAWKICKEYADQYDYSMTNSHILGMKGIIEEVYEAAHQPEQIANLTPEQLMNSKWVKGLVEALRIEQKTMPGIEIKALAPFVETKSSTRDSEVEK